MRYGHFEALAPLCPRCLHQRGVASPLKIATREEERAGELWHGWLVCADSACQLEFPVLDGVPLIVADPAATLATLGWQALRRDDLPPGVESLLGDALGPGSEFDTTRQHLSLYAESHYGDWRVPPGAGRGAPPEAPGENGAAGARPSPQGSAHDAGRPADCSRPGSAAFHPTSTGRSGPARPRSTGPGGTRPGTAGEGGTLASHSIRESAGAPPAPTCTRAADTMDAAPLPGPVALLRQVAPELASLPDGPLLDLGSGPGRVGWELALRTGRLTLGADLSLSFLRLAQRLRLEGRASYPRRRLGLVYDRTRIEVPAGHADAPVDFWALDAQCLPFAAGSFAGLTMLNLLDCLPQPAALLAEAARVARPGAPGVLGTPLDWSPAATRPQAWLGGHSQRGPHAGASWPAIAAVAAQAGWQVGAAQPAPPWELRLHERAHMTYHPLLALLRRS